MSANITSTSPHTTSVQNCLTVPPIIGPRQSTGSVSSSSKRLTDMSFVPPLLITGSTPRPSDIACSCTPKMRGIDGPVISASSTAVLYPCFCIFDARSEVTSDFPTPPLPLITPITFLISEYSFCFSKRLCGCVRDAHSLPHSEQL